jgi:hypothetical protein
MPSALLPQVILTSKAGRNSAHLYTYILGFRSHDRAILDSLSILSLVSERKMLLVNYVPGRIPANSTRSPPASDQPTKLLRYRLTGTSHDRHDHFMLRTRYS